MLVAACSASGVRRFRAARISAAASQSARVVGTNRTSLELSRSRKNLRSTASPSRRGLSIVSTMDNSLVTIEDWPVWAHRPVRLDPFHTVDEAASVHVDRTAVRQRYGLHDSRSDSRWSVTSCAVPNRAVSGRFGQYVNGRSSWGRRGRGHEYVDGYAVGQVLVHDHDLAAWQYRCLQVQRSLHGSRLPCGGVLDGLSVNGAMGSS